MLTEFFGKLSTRLFSPLIVILVVVVIILMLYVPSVTKEHAITTAVSSASSTVKQYKTIRGYYTQNVIKKIITGSEFKPHYNHKDDAEKIPLPATFIHDISKAFADKGIMTLKLYSPYPFPNRKSRTLDAFGQEAWQVLNNNPKQIFSKVETISGKEVVRVALADTMVAQGCVNCHNSHPNTPKVGWKLNDVRGILEVQVPIDEQLSNAANLNLTIASIVIIALGATVSLLFFMFRKLISNRLRSVHLALNDIAEGDGDLSQRLNEQPKDEIGMIAVAFNNFMQQLSKTLKEINEQVLQLSGSTSAMESISQQTQIGAQKQHSVSEHVASSMNAMTASTQEMTIIAANTAEHSQKTQQESQQGINTVAENLRSVAQLSNIMQSAAEVVTHLEADSQNIGGVLDVIRGIADQTNLLALNAAIEAARAGEQGRGFAVVADEVRTLASKTQESTAEINKMIEQLQSGAKSAVDTIETGGNSIEVSQQKAQQTNEMITSVGKSIEEIQGQNSQLATAADNQAEISKEIYQSIENIKQVSQSTNDSAEQLLSLAAEINLSVQTINEQLNRFIH